MNEEVNCILELNISLMVRLATNILVERVNYIANNCISFLVKEQLEQSRGVKKLVNKVVSILLSISNLVGFKTLMNSDFAHMKDLDLAKTQVADLHK
mgnify:CR=1 FL=1